MLLQKRSNGIYYFRWSYPPLLRKLLGKRELIKTLGTASKTLALARAGTLYMTVEKLKGIHHRLATRTNRLREINTQLWEVHEGSRNSIEFEAVAADYYREDVPLFFEALMELAHLYKAPSFLEAKSKMLEVNERLMAHSEAATNFKGEYGDGTQILDDMAGIVSSSIDVDYYDLDEGEATNRDSNNPEVVQSFVERFLFHYLGQMGHTFFYGGNFILNLFESLSRRYLITLAF